jgi:hypothetical protein
MILANLDFDNSPSAGDLTYVDTILKQANSSHFRNRLTTAAEDLRIYVCFIKENLQILGDSRNSGKPVLSESNKNKFACLLNRSIRMNEGLSRQERIFMQQFWKEFMQNSGQEESKVS